jgi:hypothetical protein
MHDGRFWGLVGRGHDAVFDGQRAGVASRFSLIFAFLPRS